MSKRKMLKNKKRALYIILCLNSLVKIIFSDQIEVHKETKTIEKINGNIPIYEVHHLDVPQQEYYDIPIYDTSFQDHLFSLAEKYGFNHEILFTIVHVESGGTWATNGVISPTDDYGLFQINIKNHEHIYQELGFTTDELQYDPYKNAEAAAYIIKKFFDLYQYDKTNFDYSTIFGTYNGYINWKENELSLDYVDKCMIILEENYSKIERLELKKKL